MLAMHADPGTADPGTARKLRLDLALSFARFFTVGASGAALYVGLAWLYHRLGLAAPLASFTGYATCIPIVYLAQRALAFRSQAPHRGAFPRYVAVQCLGLLLAALLPAFLARSTTLPANAAFAIVALATPLCSFALLRWWAFRHGRDAR